VPTEIVTARRKDNGDASLEDVAKASAQMTLGIVDRRVNVRLSHEDLVRILSNCETARIGKVS
jgi:predicted DNA binding CopG/RHH family protein